MWWNGRHVRLRCVCRKVWGFESPHPHHLRLPRMRQGAFSLNKLSRSTLQLPRAQMVPPRLLAPIRDLQLFCSIYSGALTIVARRSFSGGYCPRTPGIFRRLRRQKIRLPPNGAPTPRADARGPAAPGALTRRTPAGVHRDATVCRLEKNTAELRFASSTEEITDGSPLRIAVVGAIGGGDVVGQVGAFFG